MAKSLPAVHINNAKVEIAVCSEAYVNGAINLLRKRNVSTAEHQALVALLEKCKTLLNQVSATLAVADNEAYDQQKTIDFLRSNKSPGPNEEDDVSVISYIYEAHFEEFSVMWLWLTCESILYIC